MWGNFQSGMRFTDKELAQMTVLVSQLKPEEQPAIVRSLIYKCKSLVERSKL